MVFAAARSKILSTLAAAVVVCILSSTGHAVILFQDDFESGTINSSFWTTSSSEPEGRILARSDVSANSGSFSMTMDRNPSGPLNLNEAILAPFPVASCVANCTLKFAHRDISDEDDALPASFTNSFDGDGVSISDDGVNWFTLASLNNANSPTFDWTDFTFDLSAAAASANITLDSNFLVKFQQFDNFPTDSDGRSFDDIVVEGDSSLKTLFHDDFESGTINSSFWTTSSSAPEGRILARSDVSANSGSFSMTMDRTPAGDSILNEAILSVDLSDCIRDCFLLFAHRDISDEDDALPASFTNSFDGDGVSISDDGVNWFTLASLNNANSPSLVWTDFTFDLFAEAGTAGIPLDSDFLIKFQQFDNFPTDSDGRSFDDIWIATSRVPEPATLTIFALGLAGLGFMRRRRRAA